LSSLETLSFDKTILFLFSASFEGSQNLFVIKFFPKVSNNSFTPPFDSKAETHL
jgi:hypothetical protein